jgi:hypothetical protein
MMRTKLKILAGLVVALPVAATPAVAEEDFMAWLLDFHRTKGVAPVTDERYKEECGECHFAYQPGLLPAKAWDALLNEQSLRRHFGANAELDSDTLRDVHDYAVNNAAEKSYYKLSRKISVATSEGQVPVRITELRYIAREHRHIPERMIKGNNGVKSLSFCDKCHTEAEKGIYDPDTVSIPNYPHWGD